MQPISEPNLPTSESESEFIYARRTLYEVIDIGRYEAGPPKVGRPRRQKQKLRKTNPILSGKINRLAGHDFTGVIAEEALIAPERPAKSRCHAGKNHITYLYGYRLVYF